MKWDSCPGNVQFVVTQFLKERDLELSIARKINVASWHTGIAFESDPTTTQIYVKVVLTLPNSTTWRLSTLIRKWGKTYRLMTPISTVPLQTAIAEASTEKKTPEPEPAEDTWSHYE